MTLLEQAKSDARERRWLLHRLQRAMRDPYNWRHTADYTRRRMEVELLARDLVHLLEAHYLPAWPVRLIVHGFPGPPRGHYDTHRLYHAFEIIRRPYGDDREVPVWQHS